MRRIREKAEGANFEFAVAFSMCTERRGCVFEHFINKR